jgi:cytochrome c oxidase subunit 2
MNGTQVVITVLYSAAVIVFGVIAAVVIRSTSESRRGEVDEGRLSKLEGRWGVFVVGVLAVLLASTIVQVPYWDRADADENAQVVQVTAQQFGWGIQPATIEAGTPVEFRLSSKDVQHGFAVYDGIKLIFQVQVPAVDQPEQRYVHTFEEAGTYDVLCLEFCGFQHHAMRGTLKVE